MVSWTESKSLIREHSQARYPGTRSVTTTPSLGGREGLSGEWIELRFERQEPVSQEWGDRRCMQKKQRVLCVRLINYHIIYNEENKCCYYSKPVLLWLFF